MFIVATVCAEKEHYIHQVFLLAILLFRKPGFLDVCGDIKETPAEPNNLRDICRVTR